LGWVVLCLPFPTKTCHVVSGKNPFDLFAELYIITEVVGRSIVAGGLNGRPRLKYCLG
jgi:hypothetical protein